MAGQTVNALFNDIYDATARETLVYLTARCGRTEDVGDLFQETYEEVLSVLHRKGTEYIRNPEAFVKRIAGHKLSRHYSRRELARANEMPEEDGGLGQVADTAVCLESAVIEKELVRAIGAHLDQKDEVTKKIFYLYYEFDLTLAEIGAQLGLKEPTVKSRLYRLRRELQEKFGEGRAQV